MIGYLVLALAALFAAAYLIGRRRALASVSGEISKLHSLPGHHGLFLGLAAAGPALIAVAIWSIATPGIESSLIKSRFAAELAGLGIPQVEAFVRDARAIAFGGLVGFTDATKEAAAIAYRSIHSTSIAIILAISAVLAVAGFYWAYSRIAPAYRARHVVERILKVFLILCSVVAILTTIGIVFSVAWETYRFFFDPSLKGRPTVSQFLFGTEWNPQAALRADQGDIKTAFGFIPLLTGTLLITIIAIIVAGPL